MGTTPAQSTQPRLRGGKSTDHLRICERLKVLRLRVCGPRGQSEFASRLGLSPSTYSYYERGRIPPVAVVDRACQIGGVSLSWLLRGGPGSARTVVPVRRNGDQTDYSLICARLQQVRSKLYWRRGCGRLAVRLAVSPSAYSYYERGRVPPVHVLNLLSRISGVSLQWLIRGQPSDGHRAVLRQR